jgi:hypothetical protein
MHLAYQALFPFAVLVGAAGLSSLPDLRQRVGAIAPAATGIAALSALVLLLELKPSERVDLVYLRAFPGADLALRLDGLSLAFAAVLLASATGLMLARLGATGDRRNPWRRWLLTAAAALGVVMAGNLLLTYIALQVLTLAWSGAVNETAPRTRTLRLVQQAGDLALLIAAGSAIRSAGTSAFAGMPADAIGPLYLLLLLVPVATRVATVVLAPPAPRGTVAFVPAVAWVAPAAALVLRVLSLAAGRPFNRPVQVAVFSAALLAAAGLSLWAASAQSWQRFATAMVGAQAAVIVALGVLQNPLATVGCAWLALQLVLVAGLASIQPSEESAARGIATLSLGLIPPASACAGILLAAASFSGSRLLAVGIPLALVAGLATLAVARHPTLPRWGFRWPGDGWAVLMLGLALLPAPFAWGLVLPTARTVRSIPASTVGIDWFGLVAGGLRWPTLLVGIAALAVWAGLARVSARAFTGFRLGLALPALPRLTRPAPPDTIPWLTVTWVAYAILLLIMVQR